MEPIICDLIQWHQLLPAICQVAGMFIFQQDIAAVYRACQFSDINISHASVATCLRCDGIFNDQFIANFLLSVWMQEFWKLVNIWQCYVICNSISNSGDDDDDDDNIMCVMECSHCISSSVWNLQISHASPL